MTPSVSVKQCRSESEGGMLATSPLRFSSLCPDVKLIVAVVVGNYQVEYGSGVSEV